MKLVTIDDLRQYRCPKLQVLTRNIADDESRRKLLFEPELDFSDKLYHSVFDGETLRKNRILLTQFIPDLLLPYSIEFNRQHHTRYQNYLEARIDYQSLHLFQFTIAPGIRTLKRDHRHLHPLFDRDKEMTYRFWYKYDEKRWCITDNKSEWEKEKVKVESFKRSRDVTELITGYFTAIVQLPTNLHDEQNPAFFTEFAKLYRHFLGFFELKSLLNEMEHDHFVVLQERLIATKKQIQSLGKLGINDRDIAETQILQEFTKPGFYRKGENVYPNIPYLHELSQPAKMYRDDSSIEKIQTEALLHSRTLKTGKPVFFLEEFSESPKTTD